MSNGKNQSPALKPATGPAGGPKVITVLKPATGSEDGTDVYEITLNPGTSVETVITKLKLQGYELRMADGKQVLKPNQDLYSLVDAGAKLQAYPILDVG